MARKIEKISIPLGTVLSKRGLGGRLKEYRIFGQWEKIVGTVIALHAQPLSVRGKTLSVVVDSSAWMQQLTMLKPEIIRKVARGLGHAAIERITLKIGPVDVSSARAPERTPPATLGAEESRKIEDYVKNVQDSEAREVIKRVIEKDMVMRKKKKR
ncbi:MAG TPA: DUF721 domain-containing protein [Nitrospiraceae bacterium]|nr:DUF721 domain-containing protein [Nitrospiraceae bacterium]